MDRIPLHADERTVLGKKVNSLRKLGKLPGHVFGKGVVGENILLSAPDFLKVLHQAGETGLVDLKIGHEKVRPVLIREVQYDPISGQMLHVDFYQVNLTEKVKVPVPLVLIGEEPEGVKLGESIVLQTLNEVEVEALPTDLVEKIEVDISNLKNINDAIAVSALNYDRSKLLIHADPEAIVVKLAPAVTAEMEQLLEEQAAETEAAQAETTGAEEAVEAKAEGEAGEQPAAEAEAGKETAEGGEEQREQSDEQSSSKE